MDMFFILVLDHFIFPPALWCLFTSRYIWPSGKGSFQFLKKISFQRSNYFQGKDQTAEQKRGDLFHRTIPILITFSYFLQWDIWILKFFIWFFQAFSSLNVKEILLQTNKGHEQENYELRHVIIWII